DGHVIDVRERHGFPGLSLCVQPDGLYVDAHLLELLYAGVRALRAEASPYHHGAEGFGSPRHLEHLGQLPYGLAAVPGVIAQDDALEIRWIRDVEVPDERFQS